MSVPSDRRLPDREHDQKYEVTPLELFFDLVFVFAVSQLSHHWLEHLTWRGAADVLVMLLPILTVWSYTSWAATMIPADRSKTLWMVLSVMLLGLFINASVTTAFTSSGWPFVIPFLLIQLGRTVWTIVNAPVAIESTISACSSGSSPRPPCGSRGLPQIRKPVCCGGG
jgi:low temperature requirement protein LtrA